MFEVGFWPGYNWFSTVLGSSLPHTIVMGAARRGASKTYNYQLPGAELKGLFGKWVWLQSSGSWQAGKTPATTGYIHLLELKENGTLQIWKNEELFREGHYYTEEKKGEMVLVLKYRTSNKVANRLNISFRFVGKNTLCFTEEGRFRSKQHLFLRHSAT